VTREVGQSIALGKCNPADNANNQAAQRTIRGELVTLRWRHIIRLNSDDPFAQVTEAMRERATVEFHRELKELRR
jgi:hypothetical protein